jgi:arsenate reductase (thioredoxin)
MPDRRKVLVLCTGNSARSQLLAAILNDRLGDLVVAESAGTRPAKCVNPLALVALSEVGIVTEGARPRSVLDLGDAEFDIAVTVCDHARESCPVLPGAPAAVHVGYPDPAGAGGTEEQRLEAFREVRDSMIAWVSFFRLLLA